MTERAEVGTAGGSVGAGARPRAMIHKKVLDVAGEKPDASIERVAAQVGGASPAFVERVFEEFGDPAGGNRPDGVDGVPADGERPDDGESGESADTGQPADSAEAPEPSEGTDSDAPTPSDAASDVGAADPPRSTDGGGTADDRSAESIELADLTEAQRETLAVIHDQPAASQKEIGAVLGVSRATVSKRVNALPGFDWRRRRSFVEALFGPVEDGTGDDGDEARAVGMTDEDGEIGTSADGTAESTRDVSGSDPSDADESTVGELVQRVDALEARTSGQSSTDGGPSESETVHAILRVCMDADEIDDRQEEWLVAELLADRE